MDGSRPSRGAERYDLCHPLPVAIRVQSGVAATMHKIRVPILGYKPYTTSATLRSSYTGGSDRLVKYRPSSHHKTPRCRRRTFACVRNLYSRSSRHMRRIRR